MGVRLEAWDAHGPPPSFETRPRHADFRTTDVPRALLRMRAEFSSLHRALAVKLVLAVLDDRRHRLEREVAFAVLHHVLQVEVLDREVVVAVLVRPAHRFVV